MSLDNLFGSYFTRGDVRRWLVGGLKLWIADYVRDVDRHELVPAPTALPRSYTVAAEVSKWPESQIPALIVTLPGLSDRGVMRQGDGSYTTEWAVGITAVVKGRDEADGERLADVYGTALALLMVQQAGAFPGMEVVSVTYADESYDELPQRRSRTLVAATVTFRVELRGRASATHGPITPSIDPTLDPGPRPEVTDTAIDIERSA